MRAIRQVVTQKPKNSGFFDKFIRKYGDKATTAAVDDELYRSIKQFYTDLINGYIQQPKYEPYLRNDVRLIKLAMQDSEVRMTKEYIILSCLQFSAANNLPVTANPHYRLTQESTNARYRAYGIINNGLTQFFNTGNMAFLTAISVQMQNPMDRSIRPEL